MGASTIHFVGDSLLSPPADDDITTLPPRRSPAPEISTDTTDDATSAASQSSPSLGSLASLARPGLALGSSRLGSGSDQPRLNWSRAIASFAQLRRAPGTR